MASIDYLKKFYSIVDKTKIIQQDLNRLIKDCQDSIDDPKQTSINFGFKFLSLMKYLQSLRLRTNRIQLMPSISTIIMPFGIIEPKPTEVEKPKQYEVICLSDDDDDVVICEEVTDDGTCEEENNEIFKTDEKENSKPLSYEDSLTYNRIKELDGLCQAFKEMTRLIKEHPHLVDTEKDDNDTEPTVFKYTGIFVRFFWAPFVTSRFYHLCTRYSQINKKIEDKCNQTPNIPEFALLIKWIKEENVESSLGLDQEKNYHYAEEAMRELVRLAKNKSQVEINQIHNSRVKSVEPELFEHNRDVYDNEDPALKDAELNKVLYENRKLAKISREFIER